MSNLDWLDLFSNNFHHWLFLLKFIVQYLFLLVATFITDYYWLLWMNAILWSCDIVIIILLLFITNTTGTTVFNSLHLDQYFCCLTSILTWCWHFSFLSPLSSWLHYPAKPCSLPITFGDQNCHKIYLSITKLNPLKQIHFYANYISSYHREYT